MCCASGEASGVRVDQSSGRNWPIPLVRIRLGWSHDHDAADTRHQIPTRLDVDAAAPTFSKAMSHLDTSATRELDRVGFPAGLRELVRLRASQINGCAYCVDMHAPTRPPPASPRSGSTPSRSGTSRRSSPSASGPPCGSPRWSRRVADTRVPPEEYDAVAAHWSPDEVGALLALIVTINAWNAICGRHPRLGAGPGRLSRVATAALRCPRGSPRHLGGSRRPRRPDLPRVRDAVLDGRLAAGDRVPASRDLAAAARGRARHRHRRPTTG